MVQRGVYIRLPVEHWDIIRDLAAAEGRAPKDQAGVLIGEALALRRDLLLDGITQRTRILDRLSIRRRRIGTGSLLYEDGVLVPGDRGAAGPPGPNTQRGLPR